MPVTPLDRVPESTWEEAREIARARGNDPTDLVNTSGLCRIHFPTDGFPGKRCCRCKITLSQGSFNNNRASKDGKQSRCRQCDYEALKDYRSRSEAKMRVETKDAAKKIKKEIKEELTGSKNKMTRTKWPVKRTHRIKALQKALPQALTDYDGQEAQISVALTIPILEIREAIEKDPNLQRIAEHAQTVAIAKVEANAYELAKTSNNATMIKFFLTNKSDEWTERSQVDVKNVGFGAPKDNETVAPIIKMVPKTEAE